MPPPRKSPDRARVHYEGIAARILQTQRSDGSWRRNRAPASLTTLFTMQLLWATGIDPAESVVKAAVEHLESGLLWNDLGRMLGVTFA